jgi:elongation factor P hydroxylase
VITDREIAGRFNRWVGPRYQTLLVGGAHEPLYEPPVGRTRAIIRYTRDYTQSVLHEISHWCLAGRERRLLPDYGYWYVPPPRSAEQQAAFFAVEEQVQGLESVLADACDVKFCVSADQFGADLQGFARRVTVRADAIRNQGLGGRSAQVLAALGGGRRSRGR